MDRMELIAALGGLTGALAGGLSQADAVQALRDLALRAEAAVWGPGTVGAPDGAFPGAPGLLGPPGATNGASGGAQLALVPPGGLPLAKPDPGRDAAAARAATRDAVRRLFRFWQEQTGHTRARLTPERAAKLQARLKSYSEQDIRTAILGCTSSEYHMQNGHDDLTLICRNDSKLEWFINRGGDLDDDHVDVSASSNTELIRKLKEELQGARARGDRKAYDAANERLRDALQEDR